MKKNKTKLSNDETKSFSIFFILKKFIRVNYLIPDN